MGKLVMSFRGLCLHVNKKPPAFLPEGVEHRVVIMNASHGASSQFGKLPEHFCYINANEATTNALWAAGVPKSLDGWNVQVTNALPPPDGKALSVSLPDIPRLGDYAPLMILWPSLGQAGAPPAANPPEADVCCFVDISMGTVADHQFKEIIPAEFERGYYSTWTVDTHGDPKLRFLSRSGACIEVEVPSTHQDESLANENGVPGSIVIHNSVIYNSASQLADSVNDFALHYLAREGNIPSEFVGLLPGKEFAYAATDMTTSCSNSQFP